MHSRVARGELAFDVPREADGFVETVRKLRDLDGWQILAWCPIGNHNHLVATTGTVPLWRSMLRLQAHVAHYYLPSGEVSATLHRDPTSVSRWLMAETRLQREDERFRQRLDALDHAISQPGEDNPAVPSSTR